jgi:tRNA-2-methylthio-N6-dimethylallyladenosine synthase
MDSYYLWTIGCQMNFADTWRLGEELRRLGYREAPRAEQADLVVLNTCVVRQHAEDKCIGRLTSLSGWKRRRPGSLLAVMGCLVGDEEALRRAYPHVDLFLRPSDYMSLVHYLCDRDLLPQAEGPLPLADDAGTPVSMHVPISYGCDHHCTYCIVRLRRGRERSRPLDEVVAEVDSLVRRGVREVTLLGQNVDSYGRDLSPQPVGARSSRPGAGSPRPYGPPRLADLLHAVHAVEGLYRIRFLTSHPADLQPEVIEAVATLQPRAMRGGVCPHFELPIQAGDDEMLRRMARGYTVAEYRDLIARIRERIPACSIATDVIVGFPGETEAQYRDTYRLLEELRFDAVHCAAYSVRPGTPAARLEDDVPQAEKERRRGEVDDLQARIVGEINARLLGHTVEVLVEDRRKGRWGGRTATNKLVFFEDEGRDWRGELVPVRIAWTGPWSMIGKVVRSNRHQAL